MRLLGERALVIEIGANALPDLSATKAGAKAGAAASLTAAGQTCA